ncbi:MAG: 2Fe-2S iron-sulfur cluster-binding protein [Bacteroidota bacterium]
MINITIDGKGLQVEAGTSVIEAARENGIEIPHFCWHPRLSVAGNCRMCLVEIEKMPKLAIACATQASEGMVVHTSTPRVIDAREAVMEFLLINHPLDCPICDEAGECKLQDYAYKYSVGESRFSENKVHKPKRVALGPHVMLDVERCIMCSRCVRFCDEIARKPQLTFTERGDHVVLSTFPGEQLDNPYSMNVIDICPVGALTSREFRFKARVWEMSSTESICPGCARGCNMNVWVRNNEILRQTPRYNPSVNKDWMCDAGRLETLGHVNAESRIKSPRIRSHDAFKETAWDEALASVASELKVFRRSEIAVLGSARATVEDNFVLQKFARELLGTKYIDFVPHVHPGQGDNILILEDKTPNARGAAEVGVRPADPASGFEAMLRAIKERHIKSLLIMDDDIAVDPVAAKLLEMLEYLVVFSANENATTKLADAVLPCSTYAERHGTFVNGEGRVQRIRPAVALLDQDRATDGYAQSRLDRFGTGYDRWARGTKRDARSSWRILTGIASAMGTRYKFARAEDVFAEVASTVPAFRGMTYQKLGNKGLPLNVAKTAQAVAV